ncbi:hypothetical protein [Paucilactobacillus kaifaensis]|uniref:hypothetical protein n=1 Tax=Paucilactobacillus kaifaensis TaxID=2559921 RepID=UPI0010F6402B|nr:hypothetical protein [Paucilactobacillus kaifaensis]
MKTSEFKRELKKYSCYFSTDAVYQDEIANATAYMAVINPEQQGGVGFTWAFYPDGFNLNLFKLINEYAATPIDERKDEKRYRVHVIRKDFEWGYLNWNDDDKLFEFNNEADTRVMKTIFTESEIEELKRNPDLAIDFNKALEEVDPDEQ